MIKKSSLALVFTEKLLAVFCSRLATVSLLLRITWTLISGFLKAVATAAIPFNLT